MPVEIYKDVANYPKNPIILDIGCSNGNESIKLMEAFPDFRMVISVDTISENVENVEKIIKEKKLEEKWCILCACVDLTLGETWINFGTNTELQALSGNIVSGEHEESATKRKVNKIRLVDIRPKPDIIKIDIEGHEWVLWEDIFNSGAKIIFLEIHGNPSYNFGEKLDFIRAKGYNIKCYRHTACSAPTEPMELEGYTNKPEEYCQITASLD